MTNKHLWNIYLRLVSIEAMMKELDYDVWNSDDALDRTEQYLTEIVADGELVIDYIKQVRNGRWDND